MTILENQLTHLLSRNWRLLLLRGVTAIVFGVLTWFQPAISLTTLVVLFAAYALVDGTLNIWSAIRGRKQHEHWWILLLWGLLGVGIGILTFRDPGVTALVLLFYIALWAIAKGVLEIVMAIRLRQEIENEWLLILGGLISILFGVVLIAQPGAGVLAVLWLVATYAFIFGVLLVLLAFKVRKFIS